MSANNALVLAFLGGGIIGGALTWLYRDRIQRSQDTLIEEDEGETEEEQQEHRSILKEEDIEALKIIPKRFGHVIKLKLDKYKQFKTLQAAVWPDVLRRFYEANMRNYTIYYKDGWLFSHYEYVGDDYESDMQQLDEDQVMRNWYKICESCQVPLHHWEGLPPSQGGQGEWWSPMEELFHCGHFAVAYYNKNKIAQKISFM